MLNLNSTQSVLHALVLAALLGSMGCGGVYLADDIDLELDLFPLSGPSDELHLPYVAGAQVNLYAHTTDGDDDRSSFWLESSNPAVLRIMTQAGGRAEAKAVAEGEAEVRIYKHQGDADPVHRSTVSVRRPTRVRLFAHGPLFFESLSAMAERNASRVLAGGTATYLVRYFAGEVRLYGNGALEPQHQPGLRLYQKSSFLFENREWLQVEAEAKGVYRVPLRAAGVALGSTEIHVVDGAEIDRIQLFAEDESGAAAEDTLVVLAQAFTAQDDPIYGLDYSWDVDGVQDRGQGDLYYYSYAPERRSTLTASGAGRSASTEISSGGGWVSSTNEIGCSASPAGAAGSAALPGLILSVVLLGLVRRRKR